MHRSHRPTAETNAPAAAEGRTSGGDGPRRVRRRAGDDRPPFLQRPRPRERSRARNARTGFPGPEEGRVTAAPRSWERCRGERGSEATSTRHAVTSDTRTRRARRGRGRGNGRDGEGREGPLAAGTDGGRVGPGSPPPPSPAIPYAPHPEACAPPWGSVGGTRVPAALGRARNAGPFVRSPTTGVTTSQAPARQRRRHDTLSFAPRGSSPDSERGGAGRSGGHKTRSGFPPQSRDAARGTRPKLRASGGHRAGWGDPGGSNGRDPKHVPFTGSLEKALFSLRAGGTDPARRAPGRGSRPRAGINTAR